MEYFTMASNCGISCVPLCHMLIMWQGRDMQEAALLTVRLCAMQGVCMHADTAQGKLDPTAAVLVVLADS